MRPTGLVAALGLGLVTTGCHTTPREYARPSPTVLLHTSEAGELGVSTEFGVVFLGRGQQSGNVEFTAWYGDGPSIESGIIEPVAPNVFRTEAEILLPAVPISFREPEPGTEVLVGARGSGEKRGTRWFEARVTADPAAEGVLLSPNSSLESLGDHDLGAGVYVVEEDALRLVGLITGRLVLERSGESREYVTVLGPRDLWRLATYVKNRHRPRRWIYREDIL